MYIRVAERLGGLPDLPFACPPLQVPKDVISERIDVFARRALFRMLKADPAAQADAKGMICAVKVGRLAGIYKEDEYVPAMRAKRMSLGWWQLIPRGEDAALVVDPAALLATPPIIVFRDSARSIPQRVDPALRKAWRSFVLKVDTLLPEPHGCPVPKLFPSGVTQALQISGKSPGCLQRGESCSKTLKPILCLYADVDVSREPNELALFRGMADRWACIAGAPHAFWFPAFGGTPFRTGQEIIQAIMDVASLTGEKLKEGHVFGHMISEGGCTHSACTPVVGIGIRGRESNWTGLYLDRITANRASGGRTIADVPLSSCADDAVFVLHGCNSAAGRDNFAQALFQHLSRRLPRAVVYGHPASACAGQENCWIEYRKGNPAKGRRISRIPNYSGGHRCCKPVARCF